MYEGIPLKYLENKWYFLYLKWIIKHIKHIQSYYKCKNKNFFVIKCIFKNEVLFEINKNYFSNIMIFCLLHVYNYAWLIAFMAFFID